METHRRFVFLLNSFPSLGVTLALEPD